jgi:hypothetical protein
MVLRWAENETHPLRRVGWKKACSAPYLHGGEHMRQQDAPALEELNT